MTPAISRPKRRTRSTRAGNPTVIPHKSSRRCQPHFCCVLTKYSNDKAQYRLRALADIVLNLQNFTRSGPDASIPKFADVKHSGYKPFTFAAGAGRCHPGAAASAPPTMFEPIHPRGILSKGRVNTSHQGTCSKQDFKLAKGMAIDCRTTTDHRGQLASLQPVELHQTAPSAAPSQCPRASRRSPPGAWRSGHGRAAPRAFGRHLPSRLRGVRRPQAGDRGV